VRHGENHVRLQALHKLNIRGSVSFISGAGSLIYVVKSPLKIGEAVRIISGVFNFID
jgi:hypothetical protein